jgi:hypothetical protein
MIKLLQCGPLAAQLVAPPNKQLAGINWPPMSYDVEDHLLYCFEAGREMNPAQTATRSSF